MMSHYTTIVLVPKGHVILEVVEKLMAPYDEGLKVQPYDRKCPCVGMEAYIQAKGQAAMEVGANDALSSSFQKKLLESGDPSLVKIAGKAYHELTQFETDRVEELWRDHLKPMLDRRDELNKAHPLFDRPDPLCEECKGKGTVISDYNPKSKWDWWVIGGRFDGILTQTHRPGRPDGLNSVGSSKPLPENTVETEELVRLGALATIPFALVTPDGEWHEKGKMGWWAVVSDEKPMALWNEEVCKLYVQHFDTYAVMLDCHI